jgi:hypothetical protein
LLYPGRRLSSRQRSGNGRNGFDAKGPRIPRERWLEIAARVQRDGLRRVAHGLGVTHDSVRSIANRIDHEASLL